MKNLEYYEKPNSAKYREQLSLIENELIQEAHACIQNLNRKAFNFSFILRARKAKWVCEEIDKIFNGVPSWLWSLAVAACPRLAKKKNAVEQKMRYARRNLGNGKWSVPIWAIFTSLWICCAKLKLKLWGLSSSSAFQSQSKVEWRSCSAICQSTINGLTLVLS